MSFHFNNYRFLQQTNFYLEWSSFFEFKELKPFEEELKTYKGTFVKKSHRSFRSRKISVDDLLHPCYIVCPKFIKKLPHETHCFLHQRPSVWNSKYIQFSEFNWFWVQLHYQNSLQLIERLKSKQIPINAKLVSLDGTSLFTSIPLKSLVVLLQKHVNKFNYPSLNKQKFLNLNKKVCIKFPVVQYRSYARSQNSLSHS